MPSQHLPPKGIQSTPEKSLHGFGQSARVFSNFGTITQKKKNDNQINILYEQQEQFGFCYIQIDKANAKVLEKVLSPPLIETTSPVTAWFPYCCWLIIYQ